MNSVEQSLWEAGSHSASQESPHILWNQKIHYLLHKNPSLGLSPSHLNSVHNLTTHFFKIQFHITLPSTPRSSKWPFSFRISDQNFVSISNVRMSYKSLATFMFLDFIITLDSIRQRVQIMKLLVVSLFIFLHTPVTSSLYAQIFFLALCSQTSSIYGLPLGWDTKILIHIKQQAKQFLYFNHYIFRWESKRFWTES
jgi:hypothetical protein